MFSITPKDVKTLPATHDITGRHPAGDTHTYSLTVRGYTVEKFISIVTAFATGDFETGESLINEVAPPIQEEW